MNPLAPSRLVPLFMTQINETGDDELFLRHNSKGTNKNGLSFRGFIKILSVFHQSASLKEKLQCKFLFHIISNLSIFLVVVAFKVFDVDDDGRITEEELLAVLRLMVGTQLTEEELVEIVKKSIRAVNLNQADETSGITWDQFYLCLSHADIPHSMSLQCSSFTTT